jgi:hypothetical protein
VVEEELEMAVEVAPLEALVEEQVETQQMLALAELLVKVIVVVQEKLILAMAAAVVAKWQLVVHVRVGREFFLVALIMLVAVLEVLVVA